MFSAVLLADELNRTPPRTQSALLECMAEGSVTVDRQTYDLPDPFFVVATQNPMTSAGTYPLPENQLDRFLLRIELGYPDPELEAQIVAVEDGRSDEADQDDDEVGEHSMWRNKDTMFTDEQLEKVARALPLRKIGRPKDVANAVLFLASDAAAGHITGQVLSVSGGYSMIG